MSRIVRRQRFVVALLEGMTVKDAAEACGVTERTGFRWLQRPDVQRLLREAQAAVLQQAQRRAIRGLSMAQDALESVLTSHRPSSAKVSAAREWRESATRFTEIDLEARVSALEQRMK